MRNYESVLEDLFSKDCQFALATSQNNIPSVRIVDLYYQEGAFYLVTYKKSKKVIEIEENCNVAITKDLYSFSGRAFNIGHPLDENNKEIREKLIKIFEKWYFAHSNENDENMCYVKIIIDRGFFYKDGLGYKVDIENETCEEFPFEFDIIVE